MVLITNSIFMRYRVVRIYLSVILLCFANFHLYAEYRNPDTNYFMIYEMSDGAENDLEWVEYHINKVDDSQEYPDGFPRGYFQEYVLYNNSSTLHTARFAVWYQEEVYIPSELFVINDVIAQHHIGYFAEIRPEGIGFIAYIDIVFPANEKTKIRVYDFSLAHRLGGDAFVFNGTPKFTVTIGNHRIDTYRPDFEIENEWIMDILFYRNIRQDRVRPDLNGVVSLVSILEQEGSLSNNFFTLQKTNANTWQITFTDQFVEEFRYQLTFVLWSGIWGWSEAGGWRFNIEDTMMEYQHIFLTNRQLRVLRNAVYARHGFVFRDEGMRSMFVGLDDPSFGNINYRPNLDFTEDMLTETDRANIATIQRLEALAGD